MKKYPARSNKFLTKTEYARYVEAMKRHTVESPAEDDPLRFILEK
jgi:hypothetical protein